MSLGCSIQHGQLYGCVTDLGESWHVVWYPRYSPRLRGISQTVWGILDSRRQHWDMSGCILKQVYIPHSIPADKY